MDNAGTIVAVFHDEAAAHEGITKLEAAGFSHEQIGMVRKGGEATTVETHGHDHAAAAGKDATGGVVVGGILGAAASLVIPGAGPVIAAGILGTTLLGAATGLAAGGVLGALTGLGVPKEQAETYNRDFEAGHTLVTVKDAGTREAEARQILGQSAEVR